MKTIFMLIVFLLMFTLLAPQQVLGTSNQQSTVCEVATLHYHRMNADYDDWGLHIWGQNDVSGVTWTSPFMPTGSDEYGLIWEVPMKADASSLNYIVHLGDQKDPGPDQVMTFAEVGCEIWLLEGEETQYASTDQALAGAPPSVEYSQAPELEENQTLIHYRRLKNDYTSWGLHVWGPTNLEVEVTWTSPLLPAGQDEYGLYWVIDMQEDAPNVNYIVHKGDEKDPGPDQTLDFAEKGREIWLIQGSGTQFTNQEEAMTAIELASVGDITKLRSYWVSNEYIVWPEAIDMNFNYNLIYSSEAAIQVTPEGINGIDGAIQLEYVQTGLPEDILTKFPHLSGLEVFRIPSDQLNQIPDILRSQYGIAVFNSDEKLTDLTGLQIPGVLDDLFAYDGDLGISWDGDTPTFRVWAPTASNVMMRLYREADENSQGIPIVMHYDEETGTWVKEGKTDWYGDFYRYEVEVYMPSEGKVVKNEVTDPYSLALSINSAFSMIVDINDPELFPDGWGKSQKPAIAAPEDIVLYELHVRDFSINDQTVPENERGTFAAFAEIDSNGMQHLQKLSNAGLTHVHLLPVFDTATINENKAEWASPSFEELSSYPSDSPQQQELINATRAEDGFNWGYDPYHYSVPEGSYATDPNDTTRILEFREMVMSLNNAGLRVVMDVVYNHTNASGLSDKSVLDKIVPGYYYRLNGNGVVENSTCCSNTASENYMMEKLMIDSVLTWATAYKVDGFRFDLMGHHMVDNMVKLRETLDGLTIEEDGVDGASIYLYGEGWDFGEVANNARGINATQANLAGTGIGTFNDRIRDAARGGTPFDGFQEQGFVNGLYTNPNEADSRTSDEQLDSLLAFTDIIRLSLAGNLADYVFTAYDGNQVKGSQVVYNGNPGAGYTADPQENIVYVSAHDNETLFDLIQAKAPVSTSLEDRVRMQNMGLDLVALSQGVPFFHAGSELLRSKDLDSDSYDSGDWFNRLDFTYQSNNWGVGLPIADKNESKWDIISPLLADQNLKPTQENIEANLDHFLIMLEIRKSSPLFRLQTAEQIHNLVTFKNTGPDQIPGVIVMRIEDSAENIDPNYQLIYVVFNGSNQEVQFNLQEEAPGQLYLHPAMANSTDDIVKNSSYDPATNTLNVPALTTAVFVVDQNGN
jgi:pullulanase